ncbi:MAG: zf-TFIIB domain-containing protein [Nitrospirota bacterium]
MKCLVCSIDLTISERQGIEIDYCPQCRGVWLDRGELDKIIERSSAMPYEGHKEKHEHYRGSAGKDEHYEHKKHKRKSFLEDLFD